MLLQCDGDALADGSVFWQADDDAAEVDWFISASAVPLPANRARDVQQQWVQFWGPNHMGKVTGPRAGQQAERAIPGAPAAGAGHRAGRPDPGPAVSSGPGGDVSGGRSVAGRDESDGGTRLADPEAGRAAVTGAVLISRSQDNSATSAATLVVDDGQAELFEVFVPRESGPAAARSRHSSATMITS